MLTQPNHHTDAAFLHIQGMRMALASIADHSYLLVPNLLKISILVIVDVHETPFPCVSLERRSFITQTIIREHFFSPGRQPDEPAPAQQRLDRCGPTL